jgi:hypothetical protein
MNRFERTIVALSATAAIMAGETGCSDEQDPHSAISAAPIPGCTTDLAPGYTPGDPLPADTMQVTYLDTKDANPDIATIQKKTGSTAVSAVLTESLCVNVGDRLYEASMSIPEKPEARQQAVIFTANSKNAGSIFAQANIPSLADSKVSTTKYSVAAEPGKEIVRDGPAISVVGQETTGSGLFINAATERCQPLEMRTEPPLVLEQRLTYTAIKEAVCNSLGAAIDRIHLKRSYEDYVKDYQDRALGADVNQSAEPVYYPVVSRQQFDAMARQSQ